MVSRSRSLISSCRQLESGGAPIAQSSSRPLLPRRPRSRSRPPPVAPSAPRAPVGFRPSSKTNEDTSRAMAVTSWSRSALWKRAARPNCRLRGRDPTPGRGFGGYGGRRGGEGGEQVKEEGCSACSPPAAVLVPAGDNEAFLSSSHLAVIGGKASGCSPLPRGRLYDRRPSVVSPETAIACRTGSGPWNDQVGTWTVHNPSLAPPLVRGVGGLSCAPSATSTPPLSSPSGSEYAITRGRDARRRGLVDAPREELSGGWSLSARSSDFRWWFLCSMTRRHVSKIAAGKTLSVVEEDSKAILKERVDADNENALEEDEAEEDEDDGDEEQGNGLIAVDPIKLCTALDLQELEEQLDYAGESLHSLVQGLSAQGEEAEDKNRVVLGIDPDVGGAIAVLRTEGQVINVEVLDMPFVQVKVGTRLRRRHDVAALVQLVSAISFPKGSLAFIEKSSPFPKDGKQGWFSTGFGYGAWLGVLHSAGCTVMPVPPRAWKKSMGILGRDFTKDDSRALAAELFPSIALQVKRKKDHGRAEALLIAAFGQSLCKGDKGEDK
ncbi:hypothetical protein CBR_g32285 [Chara braunii]|uniref:Uncharacterized protein n=1 Tax=Chara braunii TaxID=69332 RepID=A0A388JN61_CHABU|nr:hypothetical protein CBR_g32285 [Chara braunii]|eukprot:GBG59270.1 hypothetical protein CBR_g32285 [Chara braunii]